LVRRSAIYKRKIENKGREKIVKRISILLVVVLFIAGCSGNPTKFERIYIKGSDTMLMLTESLAEEYMKSHPNVSIYVSSGGTESGVRALIDGKCHISTASRKLTSSEIQMIADKYNTVGYSYLIAKDALSIYVNPENKVTDLTTKELTDIFSCSIKNWKDVGGDDMKIQTVIRPPNSGTYVYLKEHLLDRYDYCEDANTVLTTEAVIKEVASDVAAIGFGGVGYNQSISHLSIDGYTATAKNIREDKYPITRYLHFYTINTATGSVKDFIDWALSPAGQKIIAKAGFISLWDISY
jgi:phosphate transport system substrate-binding protein